jgi:hypothetical protein
VSYDIYLFQPKPDSDPLMIAESLFLEDDEDEATSLGDAGSEVDRPKYDLKELAKLLLAYKPDLEAHPPSVKRAIEETSNQELEQKYESIEFDDPNSDDGIQISLYEDEFAVTIPYWHCGKAALIAFETLWDYLWLLEREARFRAYDPQVGKVLDLENDLPLVLSVYQDSKGQIDRVVDGLGM